MVYFPVPITKKYESENWALHHKFSHSHWAATTTENLQNLSITAQAEKEGRKRRQTTHNKLLCPQSGRSYTEISATSLKLLLKL